MKSNLRPSQIVRTLILPLAAAIVHGQAINAISGPTGNGSANRQANTATRIQQTLADPRLIEENRLSSPCVASNCDNKPMEGETPTGVVDGTNRVFILSEIPNPVSSLRIFRNGLPIKTEDYTLSNAQISFSPSSTPRPGEVMQAFYRTQSQASEAKGPDGVTLAVPSGIQRSITDVVEQLIAVTKLTEPARSGTNTRLAAGVGRMMPLSTDERGATPTQTDPAPKSVALLRGLLTGSTPSTDELSLLDPADAELDVLSKIKSLTLLRKILKNSVSRTDKTVLPFNVESVTTRVGLTLLPDATRNPGQGMDRAGGTPSLSLLRQILDPSATRVGNQPDVPAQTPGSEGAPIPRSLMILRNAFESQVEEESVRDKYLPKAVLHAQDK